MKRFIHVDGNEVIAGCGEAVLQSDAKNACLVIAAYDSIHKIGALAHAVFLSNERKVDMLHLHNAAKAIDEMIQDMTLLGAHQEDIEVRLVTGENVPHVNDDPIFNRTLSSTVDLLKDRHLRFQHDTVQDVGNLHISLDVESGNISYIKS